MAPKKKVEEFKMEPWMLGKFSRSLKVGLVGLPNVGKSTLYNSLSKSRHAEAANYPFCTIEPSETRVKVKDERFDWLVDFAKPKATVEPYLNIVDIAGLIRGASAGAGLGNEFLSHIKSVDGIIHVMRAFEDSDVIHADDKVDPVADIETICGELRIKDISFLEGKKEFHQKARSAQATKSPAALKEWEAEDAFLLKCLDWLKEDHDIRQGMHLWTSKDVDYLNEYQLLTAKPVLFAVNLSETDFVRKKNKFLKPIFEWVQKNAPGSVIIPYSGCYEERLQDMDEAAAAEAEKDAGAPSALPKMVKTAFNMVNLIYFFTQGPQEVHAWTIRKGFKAPQAAGVIHTDFERGFICAEVMAYDELKAAGSVAEMKAKGRYRQEGKTYEVNDGDIIEFKFNVSNPAKKK